MTANTSVGGTRAAVSNRVDTVGWGLLFAAVGAVLFVPAMPDGAWLIAAGIVMLGMSAVRAWMRLGVHGATVVAGTVALAAGLFIVAGFTTEVGPLVLVVLGLVLVVGALYRAPHMDAPPFATYQ